MKVTGFSFVRNAVKFDYPVVEAIKSILPICDDFIVAVGDSEDGTEELIKSINPDKITIVPTIWDDSLREGGKVLAVETDKAIQALPNDSDWAFYIQGDEVVHEKYLDNIVAAMHKWKDDERVQGLLFDYKHFYGSYDYIGSPVNWYRREIRVIRNDKRIHSYKDAQGFRYDGTEKLNVKHVDAEIFHYGWVRKPEAMQKKSEIMNRYWHNDEWIDKNVKKRQEYDYAEEHRNLYPFTGTHPQLMHERIERLNWAFEHDTAKNHYPFKKWLKLKIFELTGYMPGEYKNYKEI